MYFAVTCLPDNSGYCFNSEGALLSKIFNPIGDWLKIDDYSRSQFFKSIFARLRRFTGCAVSNEGPHTAGGQLPKLRFKPFVTAEEGGN